MSEKKTILFIEDEQELLETLGQVLRDQGYSVTLTKSAEDALTKLEKSTPDLILADIKLPGIDGFDFYKLVRKIEHCAATPFVFLTAFNSLQAAGRAKKEGAAEYITKPFEFEYLVYRIRNLLG